MRYAELHCKTNFSFLQGASHAEELVQRAAELGYAALAITDVNSLAGVVRAHAAAKQTGLPLIIGAEITPCDAPPVVLWATDRAAYGRLSRLITRGRRRAEKGKCELTWDDLAEHADGLLAGVLMHCPTIAPSSRHSGERVGVRGETANAGVISRPFLSNQEAEDGDLTEHLHRYRELFSDRCYLLAEFHCGPNDEYQLERLRRLSQATQVPLVAAGDVYYHVPARQPLQHVLTAIRHGVTVAEAGHLLFPNAQRHLKTPDELAALFARLPQALQRTAEIAARCTFSLDELRYEYPLELAPPGVNPAQYLEQLTWQGARRRYPHGLPEKVLRLLQHELQLIAELRYEAYFLTVWDLVRFARSCGILCQGRGSAANSAVCYCLEITAVDPDRVDLLFERFISRERNEAPDIDVDFEHERREEVLQYLYQKYGRERAGLVAAVITYRTRSAVREVGKALGLSLDCLDRLAKNLGGDAEQTLELEQRVSQMGLDTASELGRRLVYLATELSGFPRHLSQHVGGMVITRGPLCELVPIENAAMPDRTVVEWDKDDLEELGILKIDCLSLGMLTAIRKCFQLIEQTDGQTLTLATIPPGDSQVYDMLCAADTMGVFQIESRAQMAMLPRLRPRCYYDLVIEVAIVRPGPIQGQMVHPYLRRRAGEEPVTYPNEAIRKVLQKTLGVPIFQEQVMKLAVVAAGFTPGEADQLRRAMGAWRRNGPIEQFRQKLLDGMRDRGLAEEFAQRVFQQIRGFGEYGFPESHAASFALLVYVSAYLKHYYPAAFAAAILNSQPMGFYAPAQLIRDARQHGVEVRPVDVNTSNWDCTLEGERVLRMGLRLIRGLSLKEAEAIVRGRAAGPYRSIDDLAQRTGLFQVSLSKLAEADAFCSLGCDRRQALWGSLSQKRSSQTWPLWEGIETFNEPSADLPTTTVQEEVLADYQTTGLSLRPHPVSFYRDQLQKLGVKTAASLAEVPHNRPVKVAGLVILRQRPSTGKGITFVTLEDETGIANLVVQIKIWERFHQVTRHSNAWLVRGKLESRHGVIHVVVQHVQDLHDELAQLIQSRDFR
ncbi:MAG: error-prone DNA polymerase [Planctomycetota bacterium]|nr:error-prone DNA polymerase [Planctomycetota bacterium]